MTRHRRIRQVVAGLVGFGVAGIMVVQASAGVLSPPPTTSRSTVDHTHVLDWDGRPLVPGRDVVDCVTLIHQSDHLADVRLHATIDVGSHGDLGNDLRVAVDQVEVGDGTCAEPASTRRLFTGPLSGADGALARRHGLPEEGLELGWAPRRAGEQRTYRLSLTLDAGSDAQGSTTEPTFVWRFSAS